MAIAMALKTNTTLQELSLRHCDIGSEGAAVLANALKTNWTLIELDLVYVKNKIGSEVLVAIDMALDRNRGLQSP